MAPSDDVRAAVEAFVQQARTVLQAPGTKPEASLYSDFRKVLEAGLAAVRPGSTWTVMEQANADDLGIPDYRVEDQSGLRGWVELKAVVGKDLSNLKGHDKRQFDKFSLGLTNVMYSNGWDWRLYRDGSAIGRPAVLGTESLFDHMALPTPIPQGSIDRLTELLRQFADAPLVPYASAERAVEALASRARAIKLALVDIGAADAGPWLSALQADFQALLYKNGQRFTWDRFVDSYVQIAVFGTLLWRLETQQDVDLNHVVAIDPSLHPLIAQCMSVLWQPADRPEALEPLLVDLCTTVNLIPPAVFLASTSSSGKYVADPIIEAYEPFFRKYDPASRDEKGVFYTPAEVVEQIVDGIDVLLQSALGHADGVLSDDARFLDPATGTGTFLLGLMNKVAERAGARGWAKDQAVREVLEDRTAAFELFAGPYTIAHQRLEAALQSHGAKPNRRLPVYLTDTLSAPESGRLGGSTLGVAGKEIRKERKRADKLKTAEEILVIFGNPPYERVLGGQNANLEVFAKHLFEIVKDNTPASQRVNLKSIWDLYVAFWVWSLWALQEPLGRQTPGGVPSIAPDNAHGIAAYITNRTWIVGPSLSGLRDLVRQGAKEIWVLDLGGDNRGGHGVRSFAGDDKNVFPIQVGVAIVWVVFDRSQNAPPVVRYKRMYGTKKAKLADLAAGFDPTGYDIVSGTGTDAFIPIKWPSPTLAASPLLSDLFVDAPVIGIQTARDTKTYSPLGTAAEEVFALQPSAGRRTGRYYGSLADWASLSPTQRRKEWGTAQSRRTGTTAPNPTNLDPKKVTPFAYRPLDFRWVYDDPAWIDWYRQDLHDALTAEPVNALVTIPNEHGAGPAAIFVDRLMDQHVFRGSDGGNGVYLLWRPHPLGAIADRRGIEKVTMPDGSVFTRRSGFSKVTLDWLDSLGRTGAFQQAFDYVLAVLNAPSYTAKSWRALEVDSLRVPLTDDHRQFDKIAALGGQCRLAWQAQSTSRSGIAWAGGGNAPYGAATWNNDAVQFDNGRRIDGVPESVWRFEVSGYPVLPRWFKAREHWAVTPARSKEIQRTVIAAAELVALGTQLDAALASLI